MKHILFLCHRIPYPPNKGDKIRSYHTLRHLCRTSTVSIGCLIDDPKDLKHLPALNQWVKEVFCDHFSPKVKKITSLAKALLSGRPISLPYFYSQKLQAKLDSFIEATPIDTVVCSSSPSAEYIFRSKHYKGKLQNLQWIMDFIDMDSEKWQQYAERESFPLSWIYNREARRLLSYEKRITQEFDQLLIVSEAEKHLFLSRISTKKMIAVGNGVDLDFFHPSYQSKIKMKSPSLVFTGAMDYWPNIDGAVWFAKNVLPLVQEKIPETVLYLVGSQPTAKLQELTKQKGVVVTGFIDDVRDYLAQADVCVIPLHIARGIQNKVLEAMAMGKPVVCTPQAAEGLILDPKKDVSLQKNEISFAKAILALLQDKEASRLSGDNARKAMEKNYSWDKNLKQLDHLI